MSADFLNPQGPSGNLAPELNEPLGEALPPVARLVEAVRNPDAFPGAPTDLKAIPPAKRFPWWTPSMSDLLVVAFFAWTFLATSLGWSRLLADADSGWHIRTGEWILENHAVPQKDLFSSAKPNGDWYAWEWLTDVIWAELHAKFGLRGVCWFAGVLITILVAVLLRYSLWMGASLFISIATVLVAAGASSIHFLARPHAFTMALLPVAIWIIQADRRRQSNRVFLLIPLVAIWANLHGGFPAVLLVLGAVAAGSAVEVLIGAEGATWSSVVRYAGLTLGGALASLANPYGYRLQQHMLEYLRSDFIRNFVMEFQSPSFREENILQFEMLLFAGLLAAASLLQRKRVTEALWVLGFGHMALTSVRHITIFAAVAAPLIAVEMTRWWNSAFKDAAKKSLAGIWNQITADLTPSFARSTFWLPLFLIAALFIPEQFAHWPKDYPSEQFPVDLVHKRQELLSKSKLFTSDQWGDYLIYVNYPAQRVFVDGRSDYFGPEIGEQYVQLFQGQYQWKSLMDKYGFDVVLAPLGWPLASILKQDPQWKILDDTGKAILFERIGTPGR